MGRRGHDWDECCQGRITGVLPVELEGRAFRGDLDIRVDAHGGWHYNQSPITRKDLVCLFASMLVRDAHDRYWLVTPTELGRIEVDDAPLLAVDLHTTGAGESQVLHFSTNVDQDITVTPLTPLAMKASPVSGKTTPYVSTADGIEAKLTRAVYYSLAELAVMLDLGDGDVLGVWSGGAFFPLGTAFHCDA